MALRKTMNRAWALLALLAGAGCNLALGVDGDYHLLGSLDSDLEVRGSEKTIYLLPDGSSQPVGVDLSQGQSIQALSPAPGGGFTVIEGTGRADGTLTIPGVPLGPYYLRLGKSYYWLTGRTPELDTYDFSRIDGKLQTKPTAVTVNLTGLAPWNGDGYAQLVSFTTGVVSTLPPLNADDTTLMTSFDWKAGGPAAKLLAPSDTVQLIQLADHASDAGNYLASVEVTSVTGFSMVDGEPLSIDAALQAPSAGMKETLSLGQWDLPKIESYAKFVNPGAKVLSHQLEVYGLPTVEHSYFTQPAMLVYFQPPVEKGLAIHGAVFSYVNPGLDEFCEVDTVFTVPFQLPGSNASTGILGYMSRVDRTAAFVQGVGILLSPPGAPTVDGKSLFEDQMLSSATPTLAWTAPSIGNAGLYWLQFTRLYKDAGGATKRDNGVPALLTDGSSLTVPPGVLLPGEVYVLVIYAAMEEGLDYQRTLSSGGIRESDSVVISGMLTVP
jgi:hypothetical protein